MLLNMHIKNMALIDELDMDFDDGLNIMTGETGAGKSIIIGSLGICLGGKYDRKLLRDEDEEGLVELSFSVEDEALKLRLSELEIYPDDEGQLLISRRVAANGRVINRINDDTVTIAKLKSVAALLIDLHAQHEQQSLLNKHKHLEILDRYGGEEIAAKKSEVSAAYKEYEAVKAKLAAMDMSEDERLRKKDYITYRISEIEAAKLSPGEDDGLESFYKKAVNAKDIIEGVGRIHGMTGYEGDTAVGNAISYAIGDMKRLVELDGDLADTCKLLSDIDGMLNDFNRELSDYMKSMEFDEAEFKETEERLNLINGLKSKYGNTIEQILEACEELKQEADELNSYEERLAFYEQEKAAKEAELGRLCDELSKLRKYYAKSLCEMISDALEELNFMSVSFDMNFDKLASYTAAGDDDAYFMISTNVGEPMRPLYEVASGGELSRVMLAIKSCLAEEDDIPTLIFDEIDVGISGQTAQRVAEKLSVIGRSHQVLCITHLPQIAAMADTHYVIEKTVENNKTITKIRRLKKDEVIDELARILGGAKITEATIESAREMKGLADSTKLY